MSKLLNGYIEKSQSREIYEHEKYRQMCADSYNTEKMYDNYEVVAESPKSETGFKGYAVKMDNNIVIVYRGTEITSYKDVKNDVCMARHDVPAQTTNALKFFDEVAEQYKDSPIVVIGHSLGGSLGQITGVLRPVDEVVTFNPYGVKDQLENTLEQYGSKTPMENITNYCVLNDNITRINIKSQIGICYSIDYVKGSDPHKVENMNSLEDRTEINPQEYSDGIEFLKEKYRTTITNKIQRIEDSIKMFFENALSVFDRDKNSSSSTSNLVSENNGYFLDELPDILDIDDPKQKRKKLENVIMYHSGHQNINPNRYSGSCNGRYWVEGYTRDDGVEVSGHYRVCNKHNKASVLQKYKGMKAQDMNMDQIMEVLDVLI